MATYEIISTESTEHSKKKRFRFSESERIKCIKELYNTLSEDAADTEDGLWSNLHQTLIYDNPEYIYFLESYLYVINSLLFSSRFGICSVRLLKDHMLEQVSKFKKFDSEEASESGKERLQTKWGDAMKDLMLVWDNYKKLLDNNVKLHKTHPGRPKKNDGKKSHTRSWIS